MSDVDIDIEVEVADIVGYIVVGIHYNHDSYTVDYEKLVDHNAVVNESDDEVSDGIASNYCARDNLVENCFEAAFEYFLIEVDSLISRN